MPISFLVTLLPVPNVFYLHQDGDEQESSSTFEEIKEDCLPLSGEVVLEKRRLIRLCGTLERGWEAGLGERTVQKPSQVRKGQCDKTVGRNDWEKSQIYSY